MASQGDGRDAARMQLLLLNRWLTVVSVSQRRRNVAASRHPREKQQIPRHSPNVKDPRAGRVQADTKLTSPSLYLRHLEAPHAGTHTHTQQHTPMILGSWFVEIHFQDVYVKAPSSQKCAFTSIAQSVHFLSAHSMSYFKRQDCAHDL